MREFKFLCPECGQKILVDTAHSESEIVCPTCQKIITVPAPEPAPAAKPTSDMPPPMSSPVARPAPSSPGHRQIPDRFSALAIASLICSVFVPLGSVPGIICGHMAKTRMQRDVFLVGEKMAKAGLLISYSVLLAMLVLSGVFFLERWHFSAEKVMRESPEAIAAMQPRILDEVIIGENEDDHDVDGQMQSTSVNKSKSFRMAARGGSFSYMMKVLPHQAMKLNCRYSGDERKGHVFDIAVDNQIIATQDITAIAPGHFVDMEYRIPASLTRGKSEVKVEFQAHAGMTAGGLYGCQMLKW